MKKWLKYEDTYKWGLGQALKFGWYALDSPNTHYLHAQKVFLRSTFLRTFVGSICEAENHTCEKRP